MGTPQIKETDFLKAWALFFVCATIGGGLAGALAGGFLGGVLGVAGMPSGSIKLAGSIAGFLVSLPVSYFFFRYFVSRFLIQKLTTRQPANEGLASPNQRE
ncbi:MAG: hypothetical protein ABI680_12790 [Chthoniobacteraceae bacterium]